MKGKLAFKIVRYCQMLCIVFIICFGLIGSKNPDSLRHQIDAYLNQEIEELLVFYKQLHQSPELSLYEKNTATTMAEALTKAGFETTENVGGYGVVGVLKNGKGPTLLYRTDMDALPVAEKTNLPYASKITATNAEGTEVQTMHACGHDMHMTIWKGVAEMMAGMKDKWTGTLVMIGQPAEEIGAGAEAMLNDGLFSRFPVPDYGLAVHCNPTIGTGKVGLISGYALANVDAVDITVYGTGGHGAAPHTTIDPVVLASAIVMELQTIVSRNVNPVEAAVVTVGSFQGGTQGNVIPDEVKLKLTVRSYKDEVREQVLAGIQRVCKGAAISFGVPEEKYPVIQIKKSYTPATYNNPELIDRLRVSFGESIGKDNIEEAAPVMVGEDFSRYGLTAEKVPIALVWLGTVAPEVIEKAKRTNEQLPGLHSPFYAPSPEASIKTGVAAITTALLGLLNNSTEGGK